MLKEIMEPSEMTVLIHMWIESSLRNPGGGYIFTSSSNSL